ncbi:MAG: transcriptional repressor [Tabrizicola sp.]|nr:transcriptional repressor [Tabrizicola sp.]
MTVSEQKATDRAGPAASDLAFAHHDHAHCSTDALARAEALTAAKGARMTPVRRRVLEILLEEHRALGAYDVLSRLVSEGFGNQPPVAYRALEFLVEQGLAHRIQRLNAFAACVHAGEDHAPAFLICRDCHTVAEAEAGAARAALETEAARAGFLVERTTIEAMGLCPNCRTHAA